ncbi:DUF3634 family protein [Vibrio sp. CAU 1672]|uniref:DUF3634 family protein n=1 Tax=Vibrio sp. CAU 1672 TaxID=3032594 RepID=UPI0023DC1A43|nr:DUF3634 family protein [Vibrio sp. CAU 1672]MDF2152151.1 DUF3634 family protein [Vibrio sp. CAU 1672]
MLYVILIAAVLIFWLIAVDRPVLKVAFEKGQIAKVRGHMPPSFKHNLQDIGERNPFDGEFKVYSQRTGMRLAFSKQVPKKVQQRIRNVFPHQGFQASKNKKQA